MIGQHIRSSYGGHHSNTRDVAKSPKRRLRKRSSWQRRKITKKSVQQGMNLHTMALLPSGPYMLLAFQTGMRVRAFTKNVWKNDGKNYYTAEITAYILELNHSIEVLTAGSHNYTSTVLHNLRLRKMIWLKLPKSYREHKRKPTYVLRSCRKPRWKSAISRLSPLRWNKVVQHVALVLRWFTGSDNAGWKSGLNGCNWTCHVSLNPPSDFYFRCQGEEREDGCKETSSSKVIVL